MCYIMLQNCFASICCYILPRVFDLIKSLKERSASAATNQLRRQRYESPPEWSVRAKFRAPTCMRSHWTSAAMVALPPDDSDDEVYFRLPSRPDS